MRDPQLERHAASFGRVADAYDLGRPPYPSEALAWLMEELGVTSASTALDLGAGTGKLTTALVPLTGHVIAVEPVAEMRRVLSARRPEAEVLAGRAEAIPLADHSVDVAFVAAAFHWFDAEVALAEIHRVLRPGGGLGLLWNRPEWEGEDWYPEFTTMLDRAREEQEAPNRYIAGEWRAALDRSAAFGPVRKREFRHVHRVTRDGFLARVASWSVFAVLPGPAREDLLGAVAGLLDERGISELDLRYRADTYRVRAREHPCA
jgi:ubiquinone/menaquinone biosynthesis C-methylase UbiE